MGWLQDLIGKDSTATQNLVSVKSDRTIWEDATEGSQAVADLLTHGEALFPTFRPLMQDVFHTFWKVAPTLADEASVEPAHLANRPFVQSLLENPATAETRSFAMLDETTSALAALAAGTEILKAIQADPGIKEAAERLRQGLQEARQPGEGAPQAPDAAGQPGQGAEAMQPQCGGSGIDPQAAQAAAKRFQEALQKAGSAFRKAVRQAAKAAAERAEEVNTALLTWGIEPGQLQRVPLGERVELAERLSTPAFQRLGELIGRLRNLARAKQKDKLRRERDEIHAITQGDDLARLLPVELAALSHPLRKLDFGRRLLEHRLLEYELRPRRKDGKGPILALIDASGSMQGPRIEWAAASALALLDIARREKRDFAACYFDKKILREFRFPKGEADPREILAFATVGSSGGGTDFEVALRWALARQAESAFTKADVIMIGDGECRLTDEFLDELLRAKKEREMKVLTLLIGSHPEEFQRWSDRVWALREPDDQAAGELFEEI